MSKKTYGKANYWRYDNTYCCSINYKNHRFIGKATCHPEDKDFEHESIGYTIAETRAEIKRLSYEKEITKAKLDALIHLQEGSIVRPQGNLGKHLLQEIKLYETRLNDINEIMNELRKSITLYIETKDKLWSRLRERDKAKNN